MGAAPSKRYRGVVCIGAYNSHVEFLCKLLLHECEDLVLIVPVESPSENYPLGTIVMEGCGDVSGSLGSCFHVIEILNIAVELCVVLPPGLMVDCDLSRLFYHSYVCTAFDVLSEYANASQIVFSQLGPERLLGHCGLLGLLKCVRLERPNLNLREAKDVGNLIGFRDYQEAHFICKLLILSGVCL